jgi:hypothetical protein
MEQRPLRLGDLVDDYCPRERRVTNHAIVAIVNDGIRQTRCTTCATEHVFKGAKAPRRRKKDEDSQLVAREADTAGLTVPDTPPAAEATGETAPSMNVNGAAAINREENGQAEDTTENGRPPETEDAPARSEETAWFVHRPLIRAQLPRTENDQPPPRPIPEFTMHQRSGRGFRDGQGWSNRNANANANGNTANGTGHGRSSGFRGPGRPPFGQAPDQGAGRPRRHGRKRPR